MESTPAMTGKLVMHSKKSFEIQTPVLVLVIARLLELSRVEHMRVLEMGKGLVVGFVFEVYSVLKCGKNKWRTLYKVHTSSPFLVIMKVSFLRFLSHTCLCLSVPSRFQILFSCSDDCLMILDKVDFLFLFTHPV